MRRRGPTVAVLATLVLAIVALSPGVTAQEDGTAQHPVVGAWIIDPTPQDATDALELITIAPGGVAIPGGTESVGAGSWSSTGARSADVTLVSPAVHPRGGRFLGFITGRVSLEVAEDGQSFSGTFTFEFPGPMREEFGMPAGELGPGEVTGQRIAVEPMGEPVGPVPDFGERFPPPAAPVAPRETPAG
jgi:hypothetical protein